MIKLKPIRYLIAAGLMSLGMATSSLAQKADDLTLAVYPGAVISLPEYVGAAQGIYSKHGINAKIQPIPTGPDQIAAAAGGSVDIIGMTVSLALLANNQGQDLVILTNNFSTPIFTWLKQKNYPMPNLNGPYPAAIKDFKGAKVGISARGSEVELFTRVLLQDAGLNPDRDVVFVPVGFGQTAFAAFEAKVVDILVTIEPVQTMLLNKGAADLILDMRLGEGGPELFRKFPGNSRMAVRGVTQKKPEAMTKYLAAQEEIINFIADPKNADAVAAIFAKASGLDLPVAKAITDKYRTAFTLKFDCAGYANVLTYLQKSGQIDEKKKAAAPSCESFMAPMATKLLIK